MPEVSLHHPPGARSLRPVPHSPPAPGAFGSSSCPSRRSQFRTSTSVCGTSERRAGQQHGPRRAPPAPSLLPPARGRRLLLRVSEGRQARSAQHSVCGELVWVRSMFLRYDKPMALHEWLIAIRGTSALLDELTRIFPTGDPTFHGAVMKSVHLNAINDAGHRIP